MQVLHLAAEQKVELKIWMGVVAPGAAPCQSGCPAGQNWPGATDRRQSPVCVQPL